MEERMRIARDIITCMAKPLACSPARSFTHPLTLSPDEMGRLDGPLVSCPLLLDPPLARPASPAVDSLDAMPASGAATETLNTLEPNRQVIRARVAVENELLADPPLFGIRHLMMS